MEWQVLCSHAIWVIVGILLIPYAMIQIGRGFYYLGCFPRYNQLCRWMRRVPGRIVDLFIDVYNDCPCEFVIYTTAIIVMIAVAVNKINP